jgi:chromosome segregation ATPase
LKDFIKSKKVDEEISSYIGFVIDMLKKECQQFYISGKNWQSQLESIQEEWDDIHSKYNVLKIKYSKKKSDLSKISEKYKVFGKSLVQYKDNPKELVWEFKRLMLDNEMKSKEISFLKTRIEDLKLSEESKFLK